MIKRLLWLTQLELANILDSDTFLQTSSELIKFGWDVTLVAANFPKKGIDSKIKTIRIERSCQFIIGFIKYHIKLLKLVSRTYKNFEVVLFHQPEFFSIIPALFQAKISGKCKTKFVMDSRTVPMDLSTKKGKIWVIYFAFVHFLANLLIDGQTSNTVYMASLQKVKKSKLLGTWPAGVNLEKFQDCLPQRKWPGEDDAIVFIYIGTLAVERNLLSLFKSVEKANEKGCRVKLFCIGEGPQFNELLEYSKGIPKELINVIPKVPREEVPNWLTKAHVGVIPFPDIPIFRSGTPIKQFEYLASGLPLLATKVICHTQFLNDSCTFWAKDGNSDSLTEVISNICKKRRCLPEMGKNAFYLSKNYSWKKSANSLSDALLKSLN